MTSLPGFDRSLDRRAWMRHVLQLAGATAALGSPFANAASWAPAVLTAAQNQALATIGERIIPGSAAALCNQTIDLVLTMESEATRAQLTDALASFAHDSDGTLLASAAQTGAPLHAQFQVLKEWIADAYWSSETGLQELGFTGRMAWSSFPACETGPQP